jgi:hypothetical protein
MTATPAKTRRFGTAARMRLASHCWLVVQLMSASLRLVVMRFTPCFTLPLVVVSGIRY